VVEIALTSLALDRGERASLYARAGVENYWIVNLVDNTLEVYRDPQANRDSPHGWRYGSALTLSAGDRVRPNSAPTGEILVADLLP
jgi:Uma2 family endonuclease